MKTTMKQYSFASQLKSLAVVFGIALTFASCAKEDVAQNPTNTEGDNDKNLTTFVAGDEAKTRTSLDYNSSDFSWEAGDYIYVKDDDGVLRKSTNAPTQKVASFRYRVPGKFGASASYKVYYLGKNSNGSQVTISATQSQSKPDNTEHFGTAGDYGTATATGAVGGSIFSFQLEHQPAYLVFQPYTSNTVLHDCYLTKIEVSADNDIAEKYTVNPTTGALVASTVTNGKQIVLTTKDPTWGSTYYKGFPLTNSTASRTTNGAYMVIKPGTHTLRVRYWVKDVATNVEGTITKTLPATAYASNTYYDMTANLDIRNFDGHDYYMWDAKQNYWAGHEWNSADPWQPAITRGYVTAHYAKSSADPRYFNTSFPGPGIENEAQTTYFKTLPNAIEAVWYAMKGEPHWDADEPWIGMGHLYKGGMWIKKKAYISGFSSTNVPAGGYIGYARNSSIVQGPPSASEVSHFFYLPVMGRYMPWKLNDPSDYRIELNGIGQGGLYWTSSADPRNSMGAIFIEIGPTFCNVGSLNYNRHEGYIARPFE